MHNRYSEEDVKKYGLIQITEYTEEESRAIMAKIQDDQERHDRIRNAILGCLKTMFFTPSCIALKLVSVLATIAGTVLSLGLPAGIYCIYKTVVSLKAGIPFGEISAVQWVLLFIVCPVVAFFISFVANAIHDYLDLQI